ncbi:ABC transporter, ATP-binding protein [Verrucomicrobiia bacterium DG1235]|nr:ABC transporter, ATP-binding protein [Verrucomicrobiae bacterium DG1235]
MLRKIKEGLKLKRGLFLVWESSRRWVIVAALLTVGIGVLPVVSLYLQKLFFDEFTAGLIGEIGVSFAMLATLIAAMAGTEIVSSLLRSISTYSTTAQGEVVQDYVMSNLHKKSVELDLGYYETPSYFDSLHIAQTEAPKRTAKFVEVLSAIARDGLSLIAVLALLLTYHWAISALLFFAVVPGLFVQVKSSDKLFRWQKSAAGRQREADYYHSLLTQSNAAKESRVFGFGPVVAGWYSQLRIRLREELLKITYWKQTRIFLVNACSIAALFIGFYYFARAAVDGVFTIGDMALFYAAFNRAQNYLRQLIAGISSLYESNLFLGNLFEVLDTQPIVTSPEKPLVALSSAPSRIVFKDVDFKYPGTVRQALSGISLSIEPGEHIAIVGKNGSGKSTFVKLICRLYDCSSGSISLGGQDIRSLDLQAYRKRFSVLFQDHLQFSLSVKNNIMLGDTDCADEALMKEAACLSGADEIVRKLPKGYETSLGKILIEGEQLSQGEWQKVALARALYRRAEITILDEPTSWMDPESEYEFFEKFHEMSKGRSAIMVSHRLSTVKMVDRIVVMEAGRVLEIGSHEELIELRGRYYELFELQARSYR